MEVGRWLSAGVVELGDESEAEETECGKEKKEGGDAERAIFSCGVEHEERARAADEGGGGVIGDGDSRDADGSGKQAGKNT